MMVACLSNTPFCVDVSPRSQRKALDLHNNQIRAYKEAAHKSLEQWAQNFPSFPSSVPKGDTLPAFVSRCYALAKSTRPNWQVTDAELDDCVLKIVQQRATEAYNNSQAASKLSSSRTPLSPQPKQLQLREEQQPKKAPTTATASGHKRSLLSVRGDAGEDDEDGEIDEQQPENNEEVEVEMLADIDEAGEEGEEDDGEDGEIQDEGGDEESSQPGDDALAASNGSVASTTTAEQTTNRTNSKRKKQPQQQQGRNTKKRVIKRKSAIQKKGPPGGGIQNASNNNGTAKKATVRKKPQGKKGRPANKTV
jgi:hypothetical protein